MRRGLAGGVDSRLIQRKARGCGYSPCGRLRHPVGCELIPKATEWRMTYNVVRLDVQQQGRNHRYRFLPAQVSLSGQLDIDASLPFRKSVPVSWELTTSVSPTRNRWNTLNGCDLRTIRLGAESCHASLPGYLPVSLVTRHWM